MTKIDIILPIYKEQDNIERVLDGIKKHVKTHHVVNLVFYSRKDPTIPVVEKIKKNYDNLQMSIPRRGKGLSAQLKHGFEKSSEKIIIIMMSDLSDDPRDIDKMVKKIEKGYDFVCASRYMKLGKRKGGSKLKAHMSYLGCKSLYFLTGVKTHDATNAFKGFKRDLLEKISIESSVGYVLPLELLIKAHLLHFRITEIPTTWVERDTGYSKFKLFKYLPHYLKWYLYGVRKHLMRF